MTVILFSVPIFLVFVFFVWLVIAFSAEQSYISAQTDSLTDGQAYIAFACINHGDLTGKIHYIWQKPDPSECMNEKNNQTQWCSASMWSREAHMSVIPTPLHTEIKELIPKKPVCLLGFLPLCPYGFAGRRMPRLEVAGTNNYDQRNYNAKGTAATSTADKSLWARGDGDRRQAGETEEQERGGETAHVLLFNNFPSKYLLLQNPFNI